MMVNDVFLGGMIVIYLGIEVFKDEEFVGFRNIGYGDIMVFIEFIFDIFWVGYGWSIDVYKCKGMVIFEWDL